jgi:hypothetical protein
LHGVAFAWCCVCMVLRLHGVAFAWCCTVLVYV